jgi:hypothetical protein
MKGDLLKKGIIRSSDLWQETMECCSSLSFPNNFRLYFNCFVSCHSQRHTEFPCMNGNLTYVYVGGRGKQQNFPCIEGKHNSQACQLSCGLPVQGKSLLIKRNILTTSSNFVYIYNSVD